MNLVVDAPPDVLAQAIKASTASVTFHAFSSRPLIGRVSGDGRLLVGINSGIRNNTWRSFLDARIAPYNRGSLIEGRFRLSRSALAFTMVWLGISAIVLLAGLGAQVQAPNSGALVIAVMIPLFFAGILAFGRFSALAGEEMVVRQLVLLGNQQQLNGP